MSGKLFQRNLSRGILQFSINPSRERKTPIQLNLKSPKINFQGQISFDFWMGRRGVMGLWVGLQTENWETWGWVHRFGR